MTLEAAPPVRSLLALLALLALLSLASGLAAQQTVSPGTRLRVTVADPRLQVHVGPYRALTDTTLVLSGERAPLALPLGSIERLEASAGSHPSLVAGAIGFVLGAGVGGALGCAANRDSYGVFCGGQSDTKVFVGAGIGAVVGAALGAYVFRSEGWREIALDRLERAAR